MRGTHKELCYVALHQLRDGQLFGARVQGHVTAEEQAAIETACGSLASQEIVEHGRCRTPHVAMQKVYEGHEHAVLSFHRGSAVAGQETHEQGLVRPSTERERHDEQRRIIIPAEEERRRVWVAHQRPLTHCLCCLWHLSGE